MKKIVTILTVGLLVVSLTSFKSSNFADYGPWQTTSCFKGLDFCVKRNEYNEYAKKYNWSVKFRNRYQTKVNFSFTAKESFVNSAKTTDRLSIRSGGENSSWFLVADANSINVFVDNMRFGEDDYGKYATCDN